MSDELKKYIEDSLSVIAKECNLKKVCIRCMGMDGVFSYDTVRKKAIGADNHELFALIFSGDIVSDMKKIMEYVNIGLRLRSEKRIKIRQPLASLTIEL